MRIEDWQLLHLQKNKKKLSNRLKLRRRMNNRDARPTKLGAEGKSKTRRLHLGLRTTHQEKCVQVR